jgi:hypothetical protein
LGEEHGEEMYNYECKLLFEEELHDSYKAIRKRMFLCSFNIIFLKNKSDHSWNSDKKDSRRQVSQSSTRMALN